ncbi:MAG: hypothetical protein DRO09_01115 [Thermoprotei archaeon]|nr:MAG: hypothetical protein DRO09_01115 [Thermoprotei archaeon]
MYTSSSTDVGRVLDEVVREAGIEPVLYQREAFSAILDGYNVLITAPTGYGKTEAAVLPILTLMRIRAHEPIALLYVTPLKSLINDLLHRLRSLFQRYGFRVMRKHGDVPANERKARLRRVPHVLITTPESLEIDLDMSKNIRRYLRNVKWVIIDELHEVAASKRGLQLAFLLERLRRVSGDFQVIALSATISDPLNVFQPFVGSSNRRLRIVNGGFKKPLIKVIYTENVEEALFKAMPKGRKKCIVFVNSRRLAERVHEILAKMPGLNDVVGVHHSSVAKLSRENLELRFKSGDVKCVVATKTLELGIDIGDVDVVIHIGAPPSVTSLVQRAGRSGHSMEAVSKAIIITDALDEYLLSLAAAELATKGVLEEGRMFCYLDVVAREIVGEVLGSNGVTIEDIEKLVNSIKPCRGRSGELRSVINVLIQSRILRREGDLLRIGRFFYKIWSPDGFGGSIRRFFSFIQSNDDKFTVKYLDKDVGYLDSSYVMKYLRPWDRVKIGGNTWDVISINVVKKTISVKPSNSKGDIPYWSGSLIMFSKLLTKHVFNMVHRYCREGSKGDRVLSDLCLNISEEVVKQLRNGGTVVEHVGDQFVVYGGLSHKHFELLGYVLAYITLLSGKSPSITVKASPLGLAVNNLPEILRATKSINYGIDELIREAVRISPYFHIKLRELLPSFGMVHNVVVTNEALEQSLHELEVDEALKQSVKSFINLDIEAVALSAKEFSPIAKLIINTPPLRPWYSGSYHIIAEALKGMALTVEEIAEVTGLPTDYVERKVKAMRKIKGPLRTIAFYDTYDGRLRWALYRELHKLAKGMYRDSFSPFNSPENYVVILYLDRYNDDTRSLIVSPSKEVLGSVLPSDIGADEVFKVKVGHLTFSNRYLTYYHVPVKALNLVVRNAITFLQRLYEC